MRRAKRLAMKNRESFLAQVRVNAETKTSGSVRPMREPVAPHRNLAPKTGYFTKGIKSGPCYSVNI